METTKNTAFCISIESPTQILIRLDGANKRKQNANSITYNHRAWVDGIQFLLEEVEGKQIEYLTVEKKKGFDIGKVFVDGKDIISIMVEKGLLKLKQPDQYQKLQNKAKSDKVGIWNNKKIQLKSIDQKTVKKEYDNLKELVIKRCYLQKVQGLKLFFIDVFNHEEFILYLSQLKIPRMNGLDPRKAFVSTQDYIKDIIGKSIVKCLIKGCQIYKGQVSLYGQIYAIDKNLTQQLIKAGYTQLSKNAKSIINDQDKLQDFINLQKQAKVKGFGFFKKKIEKEPIDTTGMSKVNKFKQYEYWVKQQRRVNTLKNPQQQIIQILSSYKIQGKQQLNSTLLKKLRILSQVTSILLTACGQRYNKELQQFFIKSCTLISQLTGQLILNLQNPQFMKLLNILMRSLLMCINQIKDKNTLIQIQKHFKTIIRLTFLGNSIFHAKIFGKQKEIQLQNFSFNTYEFSSSSMSQISDDERPDRQHLKKKKLHDSYLKVRISTSLLIYQSLKSMPNLIESTWELIVKPNFFSEQFVQYVNDLRFNSEISPLKIQQKQKIMDLMKINFGEHSLLSMLIFQTNEKIKINILNILQVFICFYQGRKIIETLQYSKFQKQMKQIKSFIPKSFLVFSAYKNLFYTLLFSLSYERFVQIRVLIFKVIASIIDQTALLRKLPFKVGTQTLIQNMILPILQIETTTQLKQMVIICLSKIVGSEEKSQELQYLYLSKNSKNSICNKLISILKQVKCSNQGKQIINEINIFFSSFVNNYFQTFIKEQNSNSIWLQLLEIEQIEWQSFSTIIQNICKTINNNNIEEEQENIQGQQSKQIQMFRQYFTNQYLPHYLKQSQKFTSSSSLISLLNIYCELKSDTWNNTVYSHAAQFLLDFFIRLSPDNIKYQVKVKQFQYKTKPQQMKNNPYVRIAYLKLIGYMSFIEKFRTINVARSVFEIILTIIKTAKGLNTLIKCSWALSNWCDFEFLKDILTQENIVIVFKKLMEFSYSEKQKIASHGIRGLGTYSLNMSKNNIFFQQFVDNLKDSLIHCLKSKSAKVSWNALVTLRTLLKIKDFKITGQSGQNIMTAIIQNFSNPNFKLQLQTIQTLKCLQSTQIYEYINEIIKGIMNVLLQTNKQQLTQYSFNQFKYIDNLRKQMIQYFMKHLTQFDDNLTSITQSIDLYLLLESIYKHILTFKIQEIQNASSLILEKGQSKGEDVEKQIFNVKKKKKLFDEEQQVSNIEAGYKRITIKLDGNQQFLSNLKTISTKIYNIIEQNQNIKINYSVVQGFQHLSNMTFKEDNVSVKILQL